MEGLALKRDRPDIVPALTLNNLPEYETTSEEEEDAADQDANNEPNGEELKASNEVQMMMVEQ